jgi:hypothetical protein
LARLRDAAAPRPESEVTGIDGHAPQSQGERRERSRNSFHQVTRMNSRSLRISSRRAAIAAAVVLGAFGLADIGAASAASVHGSGRQAHASAPLETRLPTCGPDGVRICTRFGCYCA